MPDRKGGGDGGDISNYSTIRGKHLFKNTVGQIWQNFTLHLNATIVPFPLRPPTPQSPSPNCGAGSFVPLMNVPTTSIYSDPKRSNTLFIKLQNEVCNEKLLKNKIHFSKYSLIFLVENSCVGCAVVKGVKIFEV